MITAPPPHSISPSGSTLSATRLHIWAAFTFDETRSSLTPSSCRRRHCLNCPCRQSRRQFSSNDLVSFISISRVELSCSVVLVRAHADAPRRTTEPPVLDGKHPLRYAFTRYGNQAARHHVITLLISVAAAAILVYPFPFLYTNNFTNGASNLPHHAWTSAQPFEGDAKTCADVAMRSMWVHGTLSQPNLLSIL